MAIKKIKKKTFKTENSELYSENRTHIFFQYRTHEIPQFLYLFILQHTQGHSNRKVITIQIANGTKIPAHKQFLISIVASKENISSQKKNAFWQSLNLF